jgi:UDP-glucose 4-epimerase
MNILITGGNGFIGRHLYNQLKANHNVEIIDITPGENVTVMDLSNLSEIEHNTLNDYIAEADVVYHLASSIGVENIEKNPAQTLITSNKINNTIIPLCGKHDVKLIFASTSEVYGSKDSIMKETDDLNVISPGVSMRGSYAAQKILAEFLVKASVDNFSIVRFFNVVGPGQNPNVGFIIPKFVEQAKQNKDIPIYGDGSQVRTYCDIRDAVNVLELLLTEMDREIINIGAGNVYTSEQMANLIIEKTNSTSSIQFLPGRNNEIQMRVPALNKMNSIYKTRYSIHNILDNIINTIK